MEENLEQGFKFTKKKIISLVVIIFLLAAIPLGVFLVQKTQIFKSRASEQKTQAKNTPKFKGYIVEFKDKPVVAYQKELSQAGKAESPEVASYEKNTLIPNHEAAKKDILARLDRGGVLGEATSSASATPSATPTKPVLTSPPKPVRVLGEYTKVFNGIALDVDESKVSEIKKSPYVKNVYPNLEVKATLSQSVPLIGGDKVWQMRDALGKNITGEGVNIAVLDTGVDYTHPDLGGTKITDRNFLFSPGSGFPNIIFDQQMAVDNNKLIWIRALLGNQTLMGVYQFGASGINSVILNSPPNLTVQKIAVKDNYMAYFANTKVQSETGIYLYDFNTRANRLIVSTPIVGHITISDGKIVYLRSKSVTDMGNVGIYIYDIQTGVETPIEMGSFGQLQDVYFSNGLIAYSMGCLNKVTIYNVNDQTKRQISLATTGTLRDFKGDQLLYFSCNQQNKFYLHNITTNNSIPLSPPDFTGASDSISSDINRTSSIAVSIYETEKGLIQDGVVYFTKSPNHNKVLAYDQIKNRYVQINILSTSGAIAGEGKTICFASSDAKIYCHVYDPNYDYPMPTEIFNNKIIGGYNFIDNNTNPLDDNGHGTHVAAIVAGNGVLKGIAPGAKIVGYKILDNTGSGFASDVIAAIEKAVQTRADNDPANDISAVNLSLGADCEGWYDQNCGPDDPQSRAVDNAVDAGITVVVSAGNNGPGFSTIDSPGTARKAITVGAVDKNKQIASFSSRGPVVYNGETIKKPDIVAPGVSICAAEWDSWLYAKRCTDDKHIAMDGTSMAAPHVAGAAALIKQAHPDWTPAQIKTTITRTAQNLGLDTNTQGAGLIDALAAVSFSFVSPTPTPRRVCAQVITYAKNPATNECKTFPTPCDVPTGWTTVPSCPAVTKPFSCTSCAVDIAGKRDTKGSNIPDGFVNGWDFSQGIGCRGKKAGDKIWNTCKKIDINGNGIIDDTDWNTFVGCVPKVYNKQCQK